MHINRHCSLELRGLVLTLNRSRSTNSQPSILRSQLTGQWNKLAEAMEATPGLGRQAPDPHGQDRACSSGAQGLLIPYVITL